VVVRPAGVALRRLAAARHALRLRSWLGLRDRRRLGAGLPHVLRAGSGYLAVEERHHDPDGDEREQQPEQPGSAHVKPRSPERHHVPRPPPIVDKATPVSEDAEP